LHRIRLPGGWEAGLWSLVLALALAAGASHWFEPKGRAVAGGATVIDGDTLRIAGQAIRLKGVDTPELKQACTRAGRSYPCGRTAREALVAFIDARPVACRPSGRDRYRRLLATCAVSGQDLGAWLVEEGLGVSYGGYRWEEARARLRGAGLWAGTFERPEDWRREHGR
jgi:endonuclease YncB( thermonuclease family)